MSCGRRGHGGPRAAALATLCLVIASRVCPVFAQNLIANPGVEAAAAGAPAEPAGWVPVIWGDKISATAAWLPPSGADGRSLQLQVASIADEGDALWMSAPVTVIADSGLAISARCAGSGGGRLLVQASNGGTQTWLGAAVIGASAGLQPVAGKVQLPPQTHQVRIVLALAKVGEVRCDDFAASVLPPPAPAVDGSAEVVVNGGFEGGAPGPSAPGWSYEASEGAVGSAAVIAGDAAVGKQFARLQVESVKVGTDVKWWSEPVRVIPGKPSWLLSMRWRSLAQGNLFLWETRLNGSGGFRLLRRLRPSVHQGYRASPPWETAQVGFSLDADVTEIRVAVLLWEPGVLDLDDVRCARADASGNPAGPLKVSFAIDSLDAKVEQPLAAFADRKITGSIYLPSGRIEAEGATALSDLQKAELRGIEIGIYGEDPAAWVVAQSGARRQIVIRAFDRLRDAGLHPRGFAPPDGLFDEAVSDAIDSREGYVRTLSGGVNYPPADYLALQVRDVDALTTTADLERWMQEARRHGGWLILRYGGIGASGAIDVSRLVADIDVVKAAGAEIKPAGEALGSWKTPELAPPPKAEGCTAAATAPAGAAAAMAGLLLAVFATICLRRRLSRT